MNRKKWVNMSLLVGVILALSFFMSGLLHINQPTTALAEVSSTETNHLISVDGQGSISVAPDIAYVSLGIETKADTAAQAQQDNAKAFENVTNALIKQFNIDSKDIKTTTFSVQPVYSYQNNEQKLDGYTASHFIQITYRDLDNLGKLLDGASNAGANRINGIQLDTEKRQEYELEAINKAMENAESKAKVIADYAKKSLLDIVNVSQDSSSPGPIMYNSYKMLDQASTSISLGQLTITTTVHVQYSF